MIGLLVVEWTASIGALMWMVYLVVRKPWDVRLRAVATAVVLGVVGFPFGIAASQGNSLIGVTPILCRLTNHVLTVSVAYCLICFFLFSAFDTQPALVRVRRQAVVLAVVIGVLVVSTAMVPVDLRTSAAVLPAQTQPNPRGIPSIGLFYTTANLYLVYVFMSAGVLTHRYAKRAENRLRRALLITMAGAGVLTIAAAIFVVADLVYWAGGLVAPPFLVTGVGLMLPGIVLFLSGISYPALATRLASLRIWWRHLRAYYAMGPLWTALHKEFPEDALDRIPNSAWRDRITVTGMHRRFYRRLIEIRDGLVRISPYLETPDKTNESVIGYSPEEVAQRLLRALDTHADQTAVSTRAVAVAQPESDDIDADVRVIVTIAQALRKVRAVSH
ncbi:MAB_1171c family putative transporter [Nocardia sp. NPDC020380]|uniref:MAB_1171c family putative transporter n=1 Tax=Nocardia sp. NPDC020380 TaxID=3364309 RepID=UPI0037948699